MFFLKELPTRQMLQGYEARYPDMNAGTVDDALRLLRRASLLMRELEAFFASHGMSQTRFLVMIVIDREPEQDGLLPSEVAARLDVSRPVATDTIKALVQAGLLTSVRASDDGRARRVSLTARGREALAGLLPGYFELIAAFMSREPGDGSSVTDTVPSDPSF